MAGAEKPSVWRKRVLTPYVADRLKRAHDEQPNRGHGYWQEVADATGLTRTHVSTVANGKKNVGEDFALALAGYWKVDLKTLTREANEWSEKQALRLADRLVVPDRQITSLSAFFARRKDLTEAETSLLMAEGFVLKEAPSEDHWARRIDELRAAAKGKAVDTNVKMDEDLLPYELAEKAGKKVATKKGKRGKGR